MKLELFEVTEVTETECHLRHKGTGRRYVLIEGGWVKGGWVEASGRVEAYRVANRNYTRILKEKLRVQLIMAAWPQWGPKG